MKSCVLSKVCVLEVNSIAGLWCVVFQTMSAVASATASVAPHRPNRSAHQMSPGRTRNVSGSRWRRASSARTATTSRTSASSAVRPRSQFSGGGRDQASASGTTTRVPTRSPSHHVRTSSGSASVLTSPPSRSDAEPTTALVKVATASANPRRARVDAFFSASPPRISRWIRYAPIRTSSMFASVSPAAVPSATFA